MIIGSKKNTLLSWNGRRKRLFLLSIGVAVADRPEGLFRDARGSALITNDMTTFIKSDKDDIDPTVMIDDGGQAWLFWGNSMCYYA